MAILNSIFKDVRNYFMSLSDRAEDKSKPISILDNYLQKFSTDSEILRRVFIIHLTLTIGFVLLVTLGAFAFFEQNFILAYTDFFLSFCLILILIHFYLKKSLEPTSYTIAILTASFFLWLLMYGGVNNTAYVWFYTFPLYAGFVLGPRRGATFSAILGFCALGYFIFDKNFPAFAQYNIDFKVRFFVSYMVVVIFSHISESYRDKAHLKLMKANDSLEHRVFERTVELQTKNLELEIASTTDAMTGLKNRMKIDEILGYEINMSKRYDGGLCVILIDLDHFKQINDTYGHVAGDRVLIEFANILKENIRATDSIGRWGGEEFLIVCPSTDIENSLILSEKLRQIVAETVFPIVTHLTASFGVTCYREGDNINSIVKRADEALYSAKETRNKCCTCSYS